jgi:hypothetical protein
MNDKELFEHLEAFITAQHPDKKGIKRHMIITVFEAPERSQLVLSIIDPELQLPASLAEVTVGQGALIDSGQEVMNILQRKFITLTALKAERDNPPKDVVKSLLDKNALN